MAQHAFAKFVVIGEMLLFFGNDKTCCATGPQPQKPKKKYRGWSYSNREGIDEKLEYKQKQYEMKVWEKMTNYVFWVYKDILHSYREGIDEKLKYKQKPYKMKD